MVQQQKLFQAVRGFVFIAAICAAAFVAGCAPRGETASVDEVLQAARDRYAAAGTAQLGADARTAVEGAVQAIEALLSNGDAAEKAAKARSIEGNLRSLVQRAGYTTRPAMSEVQSQYGQLAEAFQQAQTPDAGTLKLAASRAYMVLASELETTKFAL